MACTVLWLVYHVSPNTQLWMCWKQRGKQRDDSSNAGEQNAFDILSELMSVYWGFSVTKGALPELAFNSIGTCRWLKGRLQLAYIKLGCHHLACNLLSNTAERSQGKAFKVNEQTVHAGLARLVSGTAAWVQTQFTMTNTISSDVWRCCRGVGEFLSLFVSQPLPPYCDEAQLWATWNSPILQALWFSSFLPSPSQQSRL